MDLVQAINAVNINKDSPLYIENFAALIDGHHTEFVICHFQNNNTYIVTQRGKIGNLYSVVLEQVETGLTEAEAVFSLRSLLGPDNVECEAGIRFIAEKLGDKRPLLLSLTLKDYKVSSLKQIVDAIKQYQRHS